MKAGKMLNVIVIILIMSASSMAQNRNAKGNYASVNGLDLYYEIHGAGAKAQLNTK